MRNGMAETIAEAEAQEFTLPEFKYWRSFAGMIDGYSIANELGLNFHDWCAEQDRNWKQTGRWELDLLHLRLMLFFAYRSDYMTGWTYTEHDDMADSLLQAISQATGLPYTTLAERKGGNDDKE